MAAKKVVAHLFGEPVILVENNSDECTGDCEAESKKVKDEIDAISQQIAHASKRYQETLILNVKKDLTVRSLKQRLLENRFMEFNHVLSKATIDKLKLVPNDAGRDTAFVLATVRGIYGDNSTKLKNKSYSGRGKTEAITPTKRDLIKNIYMKRIDLVECDAKTNAHRKLNFPKHVKSAIESYNYSAGHTSTK